MKKKIILLLLLLIAFVAGATYCFIYKIYIFAIIAALFALLLVVVLVIEYNRNIKKLIFMLNAVEADDFSFHFNEEKQNDKNENAFNFMLNKIKHIMQLEKERILEKEHYYETMLERAETGIMAVDANDFVIYRNAKALNLLGLSILTHLKQLSKLDESLYERFQKIDDEDGCKVSFYNERGKVMLSVGCSSVQIQGKAIRILALNNISNEMDNAEVDAWTRLIRVMTHEIMNSISPIASLSETLMNCYGENVEEVKTGLEIIHKTSKGLMAFVESYRSLTRISKPNKKVVDYNELIHHVLTLVKDDMQQANLRCSLTSNQEQILLYVDDNQICQVVINIIRNAIQAGATALSINAAIDEKETVRIFFSNNGKAIKQDEMNQIFIPFFTTKETGNGIGLSISRQIMQMHDGSIQLLRSTEQETVFMMMFK